MIPTLRLFSPGVEAISRALRQKRDNASTKPRSSISSSTSSRHPDYLPPLGDWRSVRRERLHAVINSSQVRVCSFAKKGFDKPGSIIPIEKPDMPPFPVRRRIAKTIAKLVQASLIRRRKPSTNKQTLHRVNVSIRALLK